MKRQQGFTIIELMIATLVFATILILLSVGLIQITRIYYKGLTTSRTQGTARNIMDDITRGIQFSGGRVTPLADDHGTKYFCVNNDRYSFRLNQKLVDGVNHVLVKDTDSACAGAANLSSPPAGATELMAPNMRLAKLEISVGTNQLYSVTLRVVAGDNDLLDLTDPAKAFCRNGSGSQFCAVSELQSTVEKRI